MSVLVNLGLPCTLAASSAALPVESLGVRACAAHRIMVGKKGG